MQELSVRPLLVVGRKIRIAVAVQALDVALERLHLLALAAIEDGDRVAACDRGVDRLGPEKAGAAEDQDPLLGRCRGRRRRGPRTGRARGLGARAAARDRTDGGRREAALDHVPARWA